MTGPIAFVALAAPQVARRLARSGAVGPAHLGAAGRDDADALGPGGAARVPTDRDPGGAVTVCLGGLYLVWLLARDTGHR